MELNESLKNLSDSIDELNGLVDRSLVSVNVAQKDAINMVVANRIGKLDLHFSNLLDSLDEVMASLHTNGTLILDDSEDEEKSGTFTDKRIKGFVDEKSEK